MSSLVQTPHPPMLNAIFDIDAAHSSVSFGVRHMMIATVKGRMNVRQGHVRVTPDGFDVEAELDPATIHTGLEPRDAHLRSPDFFDVAAHPSVTFRARGVPPPPEGARRGQLPGELTIRGVTRPVVLDVELDGETQEASGRRRAGFVATTTLDRTLWGLTWNQLIEAGGVAVGDKVKVTLDVQLVERA